MMDAGPLALDGFGLVAMGLVSAVACYDDVATMPSGPELDRKRTAVHKGVRELVTLAAADARGLDLTGLLTVSSVTERRAIAADILRSAPKKRARGNAERVALELVTASPWPDGCSWHGRKNALIAHSLSILDPDMTQSRLNAIEKAHKKAAADLIRASVSGKTKLLLAAGSIGVTVVSAGIAAPAIGTAIGGAMGLSGAAATSAGLAFLGGGSIASGGFGMAGGLLLVKVTAGVAYKGSKYVATGVAAASRGAFVHEMAKLHVGTRLVEREKPAVRETVLQHLAAVEGDLREAAETAERERRDLELKQAQRATQSRKGDIDRLGKEIGRLKACGRVTGAEIKTLSEPGWKKHAGRSVALVRLVSPDELFEVLRR